MGELTMKRHSIVLMSFFYFWNATASYLITILFSLVVLIVIDCTYYFSYYFCYTLKSIANLYLYHRVSPPNTHTYMQAHTHTQTYPHQPPFHHLINTPIPPFSLLFCTGIHNKCSWTLYSQERSCHSPCSYHVRYKLPKPRWHWWVSQ